MLGANFSLALRPIYLTRHPNQPLRIHAGPVQLTTARSTAFTHATVALEWLPSPRIEIEAEDFPRPLGLRFDEDAVVRLPAAPADAPFLITSMGSSNTATLPGSVDIGVLQGISNVIFHIPNFPTYHGEFITGRGRRGIWDGRVRLEAEGWRVTLDRIRKGTACAERLSRSGGFGITHVGRLERIDGSPFSASDASKMLHLLSFFFSFVRGAWCSCLLPVGFGDDGNPRWAEWSQPRVAPGMCSSWFSRRHPASMATLLPGFIARARDPNWWNAITLALNWYFEASEYQGMVYTSIILIQNALELIAWTLFVNDGSVSTPKLNKMSASDRLRLFLSRAGIPLEIPTVLSDLRRHATGKRWGDGARAITEIRNAIVHPNRGGFCDLPGGVWGDTWRLGVWYVEMALLWVFNYSAEYRSRVTPAALDPVQPVPWAAGYDGTA